MAAKLGWLLLAVFAATSSLEMGASLMATGKLGFAAPAFAIVGRPVTPVSVAGVARRSVRRCAVGVYYC
jgi:hypothetical protein